MILFHCLEWPNGYLQWTISSAVHNSQSLLAPNQPAVILPVTIPTSSNPINHICSEFFLLSYSHCLLSNWDQSSGHGVPSLDRRYRKGYWLTNNNRPTDFLPNFWGWLGWKITTNISLAPGMATIIIKFIQWRLPRTATATAAVFLAMTIIRWNEFYFYGILCWLYTPFCVYTMYYFQLSDFFLFYLWHFPGNQKAWLYRFHWGNRHLDVVSFQILRKS